MRQEVLNLLTTAQGLILDPSNWCYGAPAKDAMGNVVGASDQSACQWCAYGAVWSMKQTHDEDMLDRAEGLLCRAAENMHEDWTPVLVNDREGHSAVMEMYRRAIEIAKEDL